jgi:hypothetical protein
MTFKVVSFYTPDYADHAKGLAASLDTFGIPHEIEAIEQCKWAQATCLKGAFMSRKLRESSVPIVWIDADAVVLAPLSFPDVDFAVYARFASRLRHQWGPFRTGTVYFGKTEQAERLVDHWVSECVLQTDGIDQHALFRAWQRAMSDPKCMPSTAWLPLSYCQKFDETTGEPLIQHSMASRTLRHRK